MLKIVFFAEEWKKSVNSIIGGSILRSIFFFNFFAIFLPSAFRPPLKGVHEGGRFVLLIPFINYATLTASLNTLQLPCVSWATPMTPQFEPRFGGPARPAESGPRSADACTPSAKIGLGPRGQCRKSKPGSD